jgi:ribosomal protein L7/L12
MSASKEQVFEYIDKMTIIEMSEFIKEFEDRCWTCCGCRRGKDEF